MQEVRRRGKSTDNKTSKRDNNKINENNVGPQTRRDISQKIISRMVVITSLLIVVYFTTQNEAIKTFAKQSESSYGKGIVFECSTSYKEEVDKYEGCAPRACKRYVTDQVITVREAEELLAIAKKGLKFGGSSGGVSILDMHSGALSFGKQFINIYKQREARNIFSDADFNIYRVVKEKIKYAVAHHFGAKPNKIYLTSPTFFSEMTSKKADSIHDEYWHPHVDQITYKSFHYTTLLYLNDYNINFKGGRFVFIDENFNRTVEPRKARLSMFTSGSENYHYVEKVTSGIRYALTMPFTCDVQFAVENPSMKSFN